MALKTGLIFPLIPDVYTHPKTLAETKPPIVELLKNLETWLNDGEFGLGTSTLTIADCHMMCMFEQLSVSYAFFD